jgi:penicillin amidase
MNRFKRILAGFLAAIAAIAIVATAMEYFWLRGSLPTTEGRLILPGLAAETTLTRDQNGLVFIRAPQAKEAYFALSYAHAQDRMWQMEATRRLGAGRLSEIGGERLSDRIASCARLAFTGWHKPPWKP